MSKTFVLNVRNLKTVDDEKKIKDFFAGKPGIEKISVDLSLSIVSFLYNEAIGSPNSILQAMNTLGYEVR